MLPSLCKPSLTPSGVYAILYGKTPTAITANLLAVTLPIAQERIRLFLGKMRYIKSSLSGDDLKKMGALPGPGIKEQINQLLRSLEQASLTPGK